MLQEGTAAPLFTLPDQNGDLRSLADYRGQKVILYFYPKDMTAGCTKQACGFAELYPHFREKGDEEPVARRDLREIAEMAREKHDDEHDDRRETVTEKGGADEGIVAQNLLGEHRRAAEGEGREEGEQGRVNRDETLGAEVGQGPAEGEEITGDEGDAGPQREVLLDALLQDDTRENDGKDGLQLLQQDDHGEAVEMQQKQRLDDGQGA